MASAAMDRGAGGEGNVQAWAGMSGGVVLGMGVEGDFGDLDAVPPWWRLGFDGKALLETFVGTVVGLIALFSSHDHVSLPRRRTAQDAGRERARVARLDALRARLDRGRLAFQLDPSANNRRKLQRLLNQLNSSELADPN
jgi:hypothetical protein